MSENLGGVWTLVASGGIGAVLGIASLLFMFWDRISARRGEAATTLASAEQAFRKSLQEQLQAERVYFQQQLAAERTWFQGEIDALRSEVVELEAEVEHLRGENVQLKIELGRHPDAPPS